MCTLESCTLYGAIVCFEQLLLQHCSLLFRTSEWHDYIGTATHGNARCDCER
jgi:hypothetical protein